jgi:hypothetical protein
VGEHHPPCIDAQASRAGIIDAQRISAAIVDRYRGRRIDEEEPGRGVYLCVERALCECEPTLGRAAANELHPRVVIDLNLTDVRDLYLRFRGRIRL